MCESTIYLLKAGKETKVMDDAAKVTVDEHGVTVTSILVDKKQFGRAVIKEVDLMHHRIILEEISE